MNIGSNLNADGHLEVRLDDYVGVNDAVVQPDGHIMLHCGGMTIEQMDALLGAAKAWMDDLALSAMRESEA